MITDYASLKAAIADRLDRSDLTAVIPEFIRAAESRINRELRSSLQDKRTTLTTTPGDDYVSLPSDFREIRSMSVASTPPRTLEFITMSELEKSFTVGGEPSVFTIVGTEARIAPSPSQATTLNLYYVSDLVALDQDSDTNALLVKHPDLYYLGALSDAYGYLMDEQRAEFYLQKARDTIFQVNADEATTKFPNGMVLPTAYGERFNVRTV